MVAVGAKSLWNSGQTNFYYSYDTSIAIQEEYEGYLVYVGTPQNFHVTGAVTVTLEKGHAQIDIVLETKTIYFYPISYSHTITYNANGGTGSMGNTTVTDYNSGNTNVTFASNGFTRANHHFTGWKINNTGTLYQPGNTYAVAGNSSVTAYAQWTLAIAKTNVNVNGSWVKGSVHVNVDGTWKGSKKIYVKVNGVWEESSG